MTTATAINANARPAVSKSPTFAPRDFLELLAGAVVSGLAVSLVAVGVALMLASNADASPSAMPLLVTSMPIADAGKHIEPPSNASIHAVPGSLKVGGGCDPEPIDAIEREWMVSIDGILAKVRVMQSFTLPVAAGHGTTAAFFDTVLPDNAKLIELKIHGSQRTWEGQIMTAESFAKLDRDGFRALDEKGIVLMWIDSRDVMTDQIADLAAGETITVEYTYTTSVIDKRGNAALTLNLASREMFDGANRPDAAASDKPAPVSGTVWIDFIGGLPKQLKGQENSKDIDKNRAVALDDSPAGIRGASWFSASLDQAETFSIAWDLPIAHSKSTRLVQR